MMSADLLHYRDLFREVSFYCGFGLDLGYDEDPPAVAAMTDQQREVDRYVREGVRQFYDAPGTNGHSWSFLSPDLELVLQADHGDYALPCDFGTLIHPPRFVATTGELPASGDIRDVPPEFFRQLQSGHPVERRGRPQVCMFRPVIEAQQVGGMPAPESSERGQRLWVFPVPDREYRVVLQYRAANIPISLQNPCPLGSEWHQDTIRVACLAVAEHMRFPMEFDQRREFQRRLMDSVLRDRNMNRGSWLGVNTDRSHAYEPRSQYRSLRPSGFPVWESSG